MRRVSKWIQTSKLPSDAALIERQGNDFFKKLFIHALKLLFFPISPFKEEKKVFLKFY